MKRKSLLLTLFAMMFASAVSAQYAGKMYEVGDVVENPTTGKQYFLFNNSGKSKFAYEDSEGIMKVSDDPSGVAVTGNLGYMITLEESGTSGKYYLKTGNGTYIQNPSKTSVSTGTSPYALKVTAITGQAGHYTIAGLLLKFNIDGANVVGGSVGTANSVGDWSFREVKMKSASDLKGKALYEYFMSGDNIVRLYCKRAQSYYLTSAASGKTSGATKVNGYTQVWIKTAEDGGYTLRNANTGEYLQSDYSSTGTSKQILYIQYSPNNTNENTDPWCNISSEEDFDGKSCLNMETNKTSMTKWTYSGDEGCDWAMAVVDDVTEAQVREHLNSYKNWDGEIQDGKYYRIISTAYNRNMTDGNGTLVTMNEDEENLLQCWTVRKEGNGYTFQNVVTDAYATASAGRSQPYKTGSTKKAWYVKDVADKWYNMFTITAGDGDEEGMHTASSQSYQVVQWSTSADASKWAFKQVSLTQEQIDQARAGQKEYEDLVNNKTKYQTALNNLFKDYACSELKDEIKPLTDAQLSENTDFNALPNKIKEMVLKIKNNTWTTYKNKSTGYEAGYEQFFRVADYQVYSNHSQMCWQTGQSNAYGKLSNPTGIVADPGDVLLIYVDKAPNSACTLQLEMVTTEGVPGSHQTGDCYDLHKGLNIVKADDQRMLYVFYQLNTVNGKVTSIPDIKIHIEGGQLHGYWDATRGMTNADWKLLQQSLLQACPFVNLKSKNLVHVVHYQYLKEACPSEIEGVTKIWNKVVTTEEKYQGLEEFEGKCNNIWNVFSVDYNYMFATTYGTYYHWNTMSSIYDYDNLCTSAGALWGPSHEMGHNHQSTFNMISCMEVSNNLFPNINVWEQGICDTRGYNVESNFAHLPSNAPWLDRNIWSKTRLYFQLYLYFHVMHNNDNFYQDFFRALRKDPMKKAGDNSRGADDYLHFYKVACDVSQLDLTEFFDSYGFFVPIDNYVVEDYANYKVTTTQADIDAAKKYVADKNYPKAGNIMFINDKVEQKKAEPNPEWDARTSSSLRSKYPNDNTTGWYLGKSKLGGDFEDYDGGSDYRVTGDFYKISNNTITFQGTGWVGHKFYDNETGRLIWATNKKEDTLPTELQTNKKWYVVAAEANGNDVPCPYQSNVLNKPYQVKVYFGDGVECAWYLAKDGSTDLAQYLPANALIVTTDATLPEAYTSCSNVVVNGVAEKVVIDGDQPMNIPESLSASEVTFTKSGKVSAYSALKLPFPVQASNLYKGEINGDVINITATTDEIIAGAPVILKGKANFTTSSVTLTAGTYAQTENALVLNASCNQIVTGTATPFVYSFDKAYTVNFPDEINDLENEVRNEQHGVPEYNLAGQKVTNDYKGIIISSNKKELK